MQNKIHYAIHGQTATEVLYNRADAEKEFMGLTAFKGNQPTLKEAVVAKNYLSEKELRAMGQLVSGYLDFAERQAEREQAMTMRDWAEHLDRILTMSGEQLLQGNGSISHKQAVDKRFQLRTELKPFKIQIKNAQNRNRTSDTRIFSPLLYQLSYLGRNTEFSEIRVPLYMELPEFVNLFLKIRFSKRS